MKTLKPISAVLTASFLALASISAANAVTIGTVESPTHPASATFSGGSAGIFKSIGVPITFDGTHAIFTFTPLTVTSPYSTTFGVENLSGGSFSVTNGATNLLSGSFVGSSLSAAKGSQTVTFLSNTVTYSGGTKLTAAGLFPNDPGSFSFSFANSNHTGSQGILISGGYISSFKSKGVGGTFSGTHFIPPVPEPGSVAILMIGGMFLLGAALLRRTSVSTFAA
ncbi:hypothetical protein CCAX7_18680 [Capsulimonas corticalis]|uniref:Uncharacterized protein n=1 Tax=Capsulimonas corticalis TaxID=2219043 RepID=A0A402D5N6_9BACT|nr:PEP-CTERM sorting domain-containing protein [Capsulimonas corticalis]BDI29817.1 hypothetical protein CCAX7_18680 [Capsulimonas corticalis]